MQQQKTQCLLYSAQVWQLKVDLGKQFKFPNHNIQTTIRSAILIFSDATKYYVGINSTQGKTIEGSSPNTKSWYLFITNLMFNFLD